ncbi:MAG: BolA family protein [Pseudomonadota bacterium]
MTADPTTQIIADKLTAAFAPTHLEVIDESEAHRGHGGFREGVQTHIRVVIASPAFAGQSRVAQQRAIHKVLAEELRDPVHALALQVSA